MKKIIARIKLAYVRFKIELKRKALHKEVNRYRRLILELIKSGRATADHLAWANDFFFKKISVDVKVAGKHYAHYPIRQIEEDIKELQKEEAVLRELVSFRDYTKRVPKKTGITLK